MIKKLLTIILTNMMLAPQIYAVTAGNFTDNMTSNDPNARYWIASDGWSNGLPFDTCWKKSQFIRSYGIGFLTLAATPSGLCPETTIGPEYRTTRFYGYGTYSFSLKAPSISSGVVMGAFTYKGPYDNDNGNKNHNEIDIEFLKGGVQFNYYHNGKGGHEYHLTQAQLGFNPSENFHTYNFSWKAGAINFYVDGVLKLTRTTDIPTAAEGGQKIMINVWKCTASIWCGVAPVNTNTTAHVDWVKYTTQ